MARHEHRNSPPGGRQVGRNRQLVLEALAGSSKPLSAYDLLEQLRSEGLRGPPQIYRALDQLVAEGAVHKIASLSAFVSCSGECHGVGRSAFAICLRCGRTEELTSSAVNDPLIKAAGQDGFEVHTANVELTGLCAACASRAD